MGELSDGQPVFPGESEIDQLYVIQKLIGPLPPSQMHLFNVNHRFRGLKFPSITNPLTLKTRYSGVLSSELVEFMEWVLRLEPGTRPSIDECTEHYAFSDGGKKKEILQDSSSSLEDSEEDWTKVELELRKQKGERKHISRRKSSLKSPHVKSANRKYNFAFHSSDKKVSDDDIGSESNDIEELSSFQGSLTKKPLTETCNSSLSSYNGISNKFNENAKKSKRKGKTSLISQNVAGLNSSFSHSTIKDEWASGQSATAGLGKGFMYSRQPAPLKKV